MNLFVFGEKKVGYGIGTKADGTQYLVIQQLDKPYEERLSSFQDAHLQFPNRQEFKNWIDSLQEFIPFFKE